MNLQAHVHRRHRSALLDVKYGYMYNPAAVNDARHIANTGWRVMYVGFSGAAPFADFNTIIAEFGPTSFPYKATGTDYWTVADGTNLSNLGARGAGYRASNGVYGGFGEYAMFIGGQYDAGAGNVNDFAGIDQAGGTITTDVVSSANDAFSVLLVKETPTAEEIALPDGSECLPYTLNNGNTQSTIKVSGLVVLAQPLAETHYRNGDLIPLVTGTAAWGALTDGARCYPNNNSLNV